MKIYVKNGGIRLYKLLIQNGDQVGNKIIKEMKTGINHLILQALLSLGESGFTWQSAQLDLGQCVSM